MTLYIVVIILIFSLMWTHQELYWVISFHPKIRWILVGVISFVFYSKIRAESIVTIVLLLNKILLDSKPVYRVTIVTQYTLQSLGPSGCSGTSRRGAGEYWAWDRTEGGRHRRRGWLVVAVRVGCHAVLARQSPLHSSSIPSRILSCNPFLLHPPLRGPRTRIYIARLS